MSLGQDVPVHLTAVLPPLVLCSRLPPLFLPSSSPSLVSYTFILSSFTSVPLCLSILCFFYVGHARYPGFLFFTPSRHNLSPSLTPPACLFFFLLYPSSRLPSLPEPHPVSLLSLASHSIVSPVSFSLPFTCSQMFLLLSLTLLLSPILSLSSILLSPCTSLSPPSCPASLPLPSSSSCSH